jgi:hypothetical protein
MTEKTFNLIDFVAFAKENMSGNNILSLFNDTITYYETSLGGCNCSKKTRQNFAQDKFEEKINSLDTEILNSLKTILNLSSDDKLMFKNKNNEIFKTI